MHRTEQSFKALHQRLVLLEERQQGPSDEQVERVLRKILAERFGDTSTLQAENPSRAKEVEFFVEDPKEDRLAPMPLQIDYSAIHVDPKDFPSKAYQQTLGMLENDITTFPRVQLDNANSAVRVPESKDTANTFKRPKQPNSQPNSKPWS